MSAALTSSPSEVAALAAEFESASATEILRWAFEQFGRSAAIGTSFQGAGLVTIHHAVAAGLPLPVFTIDTGLLFPETLELKTRLEDYFGIVIEVIGSGAHCGAAGAGYRPGTLAEQSRSLLHVAKG